MFYANGKKVVPANIAELLTVRALAYWIMDEGGKERKIATELLFFTLVLSLLPMYYYFKPL
jgi:hypothetical protein